MSGRLERKTSQKVLMTACRLGIRKASAELASQGLSYSPSRISRMFKSRQHLLTVFTWVEIEKHKGYEQLRDVFNTPAG